MSREEPFDLWKTGQGEDLGGLDDCAGTTNNILWKANRGIYNLSKDRQTLLNYWLQEMHDNLMDDIFNAVNETETLKQCVAQVHDEVDRRVLETAEVIGVTTSGLA